MNKATNPDPTHPDQTNIDQTNIDMLASMMETTGAVIAEVRSEQLDLPTPCPDFTVRDLLEHISVWVQVFDAAVNETTVPFNPMEHRISEGWLDIFATSQASIIAGLRTRGIDRPMAMTGDPIPGSFVMSMLLMEYVGHGWDLAQTIGSSIVHTDEEATVALTSAQSIIEPKYRGHGMFGEIVNVDPQASPIDQLVGFLGRDPGWQVR